MTVTGQKQKVGRVTSVVQSIWRWHKTMVGGWGSPDSGNLNFKILLTLKSTYLATQFLEWIETAEVVESQSTSDIHSARQFTLSWVLVSSLLSFFFSVYPLCNKGSLLVSSIAHPVLTLSTSSIFRTHLNIFTRVIFKIYLYVEILTSMLVTLLLPHRFTHSWSSSVWSFPCLK